MRIYRRYRSAMANDPVTDRYSSVVQKGLAEMLAGQGYAPAAVEALLTLDATQFQFQRRSAKNEFLHVLMARLGITLEPAQLQGLYAVARIAHGIHRPAPMPATIGLVAEELALDPSRASRIVSDLVAGGYVARAVAQDDGRVSVIELTAQGTDLITRLRQDRWGMFLTLFSSWSQADIIAFSTLFARYADDMARMVADAAAQVHRP